MLRTLKMVSNPVFPTKKENISLNESWGFVISRISDSSSLEIANE